MELLGFMRIVGQLTSLLKRWVSVENSQWLVKLFSTAFCPVFSFELLKSALDIFGENLTVVHFLVVGPVKLFLLFRKGQFEVAFEPASFDWVRRRNVGALNIAYIISLTYCSEISVVRQMTSLGSCFPLQALKWWLKHWVRSVVYSSTGMPRSLALPVSPCAVRRRTFYCYDSRSFRTESICQPVWSLFAEPSSRGLL